MVMTQTRQYGVSTGLIKSYSRQIKPTSGLDFLTTAGGEPRIYWTKDDITFAGYGVAERISVSGDDRFAQLRHKLDDLFAAIENDSDHPFVIPRLFGGFSFQADFQPDGMWQPFSPAYFVLPHLLITRIGNETWLTVNSPTAGKAEFDAARRIVEKTRNPAEKPHLNFDVSYPLSLVEWREQITWATTRLKANELQKVVLSRSCDLIFDTPVNPLMALEALTAKYPETFRFLIEPAAGSAFFGASPELLVQVDGRQFSTVGLAGSTRRGATTEEDEKLAKQLMANPKEVYEHQLVVSALRQALEPLTRTLDIGEMGIYRLKNIQHLHTPVKGELIDGLHLLDMVRVLHPTPALGGTPRETAMETIRSTEPITRGWYASPVGWIDAAGRGTFAVAIRSAVSSGKRARLYAGAGIVADSDPDREWEETRLKFRPMLDALGIKEQAFLSI